LAVAYLLGEAEERPVGPGHFGQQRLGAAQMIVREPEQVW